MSILHINGRTVAVDVDEDTPLLWVIRDVVGLTGAKFGCGIGMCGACTVHVGGRPTRSCITAVGAVADAEVTTIEGLDPNGRHPLQKAWINLQVPRCGYCQSGQIMQAAALLRDFPTPTDQDIDGDLGVDAVACGTGRLRRNIDGIGIAPDQPPLRGGFDRHFRQLVGGEAGAPPARPG